MNLKTLLFSSACAMIAFHGNQTNAYAQANIVTNGKSTFTIVLPTNAPSSVQKAAAELRKDIELATGAKLSLQKDNTSIVGNFISVGNTKQAQSININSGQMASESFRIVTKDDNLYIIGPDSPEKGRASGNSYGGSSGTAHGVYTFLEDYLNVRWLMPGDIGRDVPHKSTFTLPEIDRTETPDFKWRYLGHLVDFAQNSTQLQSVEDWIDHLKLGGSNRPPFQHSWLRTIHNAINRGRDKKVSVPEAVKILFSEHPGWFPMDENGKRAILPRADRYTKLETTNQDLVHWFAEQAIQEMKESGNPAYSLSPSDGGSWSQSPESKALYDPSPSELYDVEVGNGPGTSSLILKWYHDVASIVAKEYPEGHLGGYIYASYLYPPTKVSMKLPSNFSPTIAFSPSYGFGLYRPKTQKVFEEVMDAWAKVAPEDWYYYDLPTLMFRQHSVYMGSVDASANFPGSTAFVSPTATGILNRIFRNLHRNHIKGAILYGTASMSSGALSNYLQAKMMWNPTLDADDIQHEWLQRAYGSQAGAVMEKFLRQLDGWYREYYQQNEKASYQLNFAILKGIYTAHYPEMEKTFLDAKAQPMTEIQQRRLQLIGDNLIALQWRMRNAGLWPKGVPSQLQRSDAQVIDIISKGTVSDDFNEFPGAATTTVVGWNRSKNSPKKVQLSDGNISSKSTFTSIKDGHILIYAAQDGAIQIMPKQVYHSAWFANYEIDDETGQRMKWGVLRVGEPITFSAKKGQTYHLILPPRRAVTYTLQIPNAVEADASIEDGVVTFSGKPASIYVFGASRDVPIGIMEENNSIIIRNPYSGAAAVRYYTANFMKKQVIDLDAGWLFNPDPNNNGIKNGVLNVDFDDSSWKPISPLNWWQKQGFEEYHGVAWYRLKFNASEINEGGKARIYFGGIDGNAEIYLNGKKIGEHILGVDYEGWNKEFGVKADSAIKQGENILAVKVTSKNATSGSGIFKGVAFYIGTPRAK